MKLDALKEVNWKRLLNTIAKAMMDMKNLSLLALFAFIIYGIGWDTVLRPSLDELKKRDEEIRTQQGSLDEKVSQKQQYEALQKQLEGLDVAMVEIPAGNSSTVLSVAESAELTEIAKGRKRNDAVLPPLMPPHDKREEVTVTSAGNSPVDLLNPDGSTAPAATPDPGSASAQPPAGPGGTGTENTVTVTTLPAERFDYEIKIRGTYPALVDLINELTMRKKLVKINKVIITRPETPDEPDPDPKASPDYPVKLDMVLSVSVFLYAASAS